VLCGLSKARGGIPHTGIRIAVCVSALTVSKTTIRNSTPRACKIHFMKYVFWFGNSDILNAIHILIIYRILYIHIPYLKKVGLFLQREREMSLP
jgi:hypothetical protein